MRRKIMFSPQSRFLMQDLFVMQDLFGICDKIFYAIPCCSSSALWGMISFFTISVT